MGKRERPGDHEVSRSQSTQEARGNHRRVRDQSKPRNRHTHTHTASSPDAPAHALPFTQQGTRNPLCPMKTHPNLWLQNRVIHLPLFPSLSPHSSPTKSVNIYTRRHTEMRTPPSTPDHRQMDPSSQTPSSTWPGLFPAGSPSSEPRDGQTAAWDHTENLSVGLGVDPQRVGRRQHGHREQWRGSAGVLQADPHPCGLPTPRSQPIWTRTSPRSILNTAVSIGTRASATRPPAHPHHSGLRGREPTTAQPVSLHPRPNSLTHQTCSRPHTCS